ncbi:MAG: hypothetical protein RLZZ214_2794 [Verrucomicrobiota bacterium]|jgi:peptidoglycan/LPS O-acetylase OafA/YrhL
MLEKGYETPGKPKDLSFWDKSYFAPLDGIRFILIIMVIGFHVKAPDPKQVVLQNYMCGTLAVDAFFVISGFLITTLLLREERNSGRILLGGFYIRRAFRIIPVYGVAILAYLVIGLLPSQHEILTRTLAGLPYFFSFRNEYVPPGLDVTLGHTWSLSVEEKFYFFWPLLFFIFLPRLRSRWLIVFVPVVLFFTIPQHKLFLAYMSIFSGCAVAIGMEQMRDKGEMFTRVFKKIPMWLMIAAGLASYLVALRYYASCKFLFTLYICLLIPYLLMVESMLGRALSHPACVWMGKRAYAMYLFHAIFLNFTQTHILIAKNNTNFLIVVVIAYTLTLMAAHAVFLILEKPMIDMGRKLSRRSASRSSSLSPATLPSEP